MERGKEEIKMTEKQEKTYKKLLAAYNKRWIAIDDLENKRREKFLKQADAKWKKISAVYENKKNHELGKYHEQLRKVTSK